MIHKVFTLDISDKGELHGQNDGTQVMSKLEAKWTIAFLLSHAKRISQTCKFDCFDMLEIQTMADRMIDNSKEVLN